MCQLCTCALLTLLSFVYFWQSIDLIYFGLSICICTCTCVFIYNCTHICIHICISICVCIYICSILDIFFPTKVVKFTPIFFLFLGQEAFLPSLTRLAARIENLLRICWRASEKDLWEYQIGFICFPTQLLPNFFLPIYRIQSQSLPNKTHH